MKTTAWKYWTVKYNWSQWLTRQMQFWLTATGITFKISIPWIKWQVRLRGSMSRILLALIIAIKTIDLVRALGKFRLIETLLVEESWKIIIKNESAF